MTGISRTPPRFVPTLTTVLGEAASSGPLQPSGGVDAQMKPAVAAPSPAPPPISQIALDPASQLDEIAAFQLEEQLLHRVLQRIDLSLEDRLSDAVAAAVQQQLDHMIPRLRGEIEGVLRSLVVEALAGELSESTGSVPALRPKSLG